MPFQASYDEGVNILGHQTRVVITGMVQFIHSGWDGWFVLIFERIEEGKSPWRSRNNFRRQENMYKLSVKYLTMANYDDTFKGGRHFR